MRRLILVGCVLLLAGCGGSSGDGATDATSTPQAQTAPSQPTTPQQQSPQDPQAQKDAQVPEALRLPKGVPSQASGAPDAARTAVVRTWAARLRHGNVEGAAQTFAQPSRVQNDTPVIKLVNKDQRLAFNASFPCGAVPTRFGGASDGYVIVAFRLVQRTGGECGQSVGASARCAIRVQDGRITDWYRLADGGSSGGGGGGGQETPVDPGTNAA